VRVIAHREETRAKLPPALPRSAGQGGNRTNTSRAFFDLPTTIAQVNIEETPVLWLNGPSGVGKSTVAFAIFRQLNDAGTKSAFVDVDQVGLCYPPPRTIPTTTA
jgi:DNA-binding NtrC family response regulator